METLEASFRVVQPWLDEELVPAAAVQNLSRSSAELAALHCAGFEVRLGGRDDTVDLVQRIRGLQGEPQTLARHIESTQLSEDPIWGRIRDFCRVWSPPTTLQHRMVAGCFLGLDTATPGSGSATPSVYLSLEPGSAGDAERLRELVVETATLLRGEALSEAVIANLVSCHRGCPEGASVTDVGFMLSRDIDAVRLVMAPLSKTVVAEFVDAATWGGEPPATSRALELIPDDVEQIGLSLDVGAQLFARVGIEYYPGPLAADLPVWERCLDELVGASLCVDRERDALLRWPGHIEPTDTDSEWPASLLVESMLSRPDRFMVLARRLTFLKLVCQPGSLPEAKAYFGYGPRSYTVVGAGEQPAGAAAEMKPPPRGAGHGVPGRRPPRAGPGRSHAALQSGCKDAIVAAGGCLLERRDGDAMWKEFPRILEGTDEWVTAYIGVVLAALPGAPHRRAAKQAFTWLCGQRGPADGWGYNAGLPHDADSTLWALRLADALGEPAVRRLQAARRVLEAHLLDSGGVATYRPDAETGLRTLLGPADLTGMYVAHTCVSAAVAALEGFDARLQPFLVGKQEDDGRWRGYWWSDDEYTSALATATLAGSQEAACTSSALRARRWAARRFDRSGAVWSRTLGGASAFATALSVDIILTTESLADASAPDRSAVDRGIEWLLDAQSDDGSWPASALMRMPPTHATDGDERPAATTVSVDDRALFTTATVVRTLQRMVDSGA